MENYYENRCMSAEEAAELVESGDRLWTPLNLGQPTELIMDAIADRKDELEDIEYLNALTLRPYKIFQPEYRDTFKVGVGYYSPVTREAIAKTERANFFPAQSSDVSRKNKERNRIYPRRQGVITQVTPPDKHGYVNLGLDMFYTPNMIEQSEYVIAEVNEEMPRTYGSTNFHVSEFDAFVENSNPLPTQTPPEPSDVEEKIAENVVTLLEDKDCFQLGIGAVPDMIAELLVESDLEELGIHTEMVPLATPKLISEEVVTCEHKEVNPGKVICAFALGDEKLYEWMDENPMCELYPTSYCNSMEVLSTEKNLVAINGSLEVDLTGQICSESIGNTMYSGTGGQLDFVIGSFWSKGGRAINLCPSTSKDGEKSRIVPYLSEGARVTVPRHYTGYVVTEYGVADLYGRTEPERAEALIEVAHPDFRHELEEGARERGLLK